MTYKIKKQKEKKLDYNTKNMLFIEWQIKREKRKDFADKLWFHDWLKYKGYK